MYHLSRGFVISILGIAGLAAPAQATEPCAAAPTYDHVVASDGSGDFASIQAAIDASAAGDEILVRCGDYTEHTDGPGVAGMLYLRGGVSITGEELGCVVVHSSPTVTLTRSAAIVVGDGSWDASVRNLILLHVHPADEPLAAQLGWGEIHTYTAVSTCCDYNTGSGELAVRNVVFSLPVNHEKSIFYANFQDKATVFDNVTIDFGTGTAGWFEYQNYGAERAALTNTIVSNVVLASRAWGGLRTFTDLTLAYTLINGPTPVPGLGNLLDIPWFIDPGSLDWRLQAGSPAIDAGDPALTDADGSRRDMGAWGGACVAVDSDHDGVRDAVDNCRDAANSDQADSDSDGSGDLCDVCRDVSDPVQADSDGDGVGDVCDLCPSDFDPVGADGDLDRVPDACDNCPSASNLDQADLDGDGPGDTCDLAAFGEGSCPGQFYLGIAGLTPRGRYIVIKAPTLGADVIPLRRPCGGFQTDLSLVGARVVVDGFAPATGEIAFLPTLSAVACGSAVQVVDLTTCGRSQAVMIGI
jgi:hypothetical protein